MSESEWMVTASDIYFSWYRHIRRYTITGCHDYSHFEVAGALAKFCIYLCLARNAQCVCVFDVYASPKVKELFRSKLLYEFQAIRLIALLAQVIHSLTKSLSALPTLLPVSTRADLFIVLFRFTWKTECIWFAWKLIIPAEYPSKEWIQERTITYRYR